MTDLAPLPVYPAASLALAPAPLASEQVLAGDPVVRATELRDDGRVTVGVWEHKPGMSSDVESDEVFVVLAGWATVEVEGGPRLELRLGDVAFLEAGWRTRWTVHETLRKVYVTLG